jgi:hypothetical protein
MIYSGADQIRDVFADASSLGLIDSNAVVLGNGRLTKRRLASICPKLTELVSNLFQHRRFRTSAVPAVNDPFADDPTVDDWDQEKAFGDWGTDGGPSPDED